MAARLGNVVYWLGCGLASLSLLAAVLMVVITLQGPILRLAEAALLTVIGIVCWLVGRAFRYILAST